MPGRLPLWLDGKEPACNAGDVSSMLGWGRSPGEGNGSPFQNSCLGNPRDREAWQTTVHGVAKELNTHTHTHTHTHTQIWIGCSLDMHTANILGSPPQNYYLCLLSVLVTMLMKLKKKMLRPCMFEMSLIDSHI